MLRKNRLNIFIYKMYQSLFDFYQMWGKDTILGIIFIQVLNIAVKDALAIAEGCHGFCISTLVFVACDCDYLLPQPNPTLR